MSADRGQWEKDQLAREICRTGKVIDTARGLFREAVEAADNANRCGDDLTVRRSLAHAAETFAAAGLDVLRRL